MAMALNDHQIDILDLYQSQELRLAELYRAFGDRFTADQTFWNRLVHEEQVHAQIIEKLRDATQKGVLIFDAAKVGTETLKVMIDRIQRLLQRALAGELNRIEALAQALDLESALIEKGVFTRFEPLTEKARAVLRKLNAETLDHVVRVREMYDISRQDARKPAETQAKPPEPAPSGVRLVWTAAMSVGIPRIDAQHRFLFEQINKLAAMRARSGSRDQLLEMIRVFIHFSDAHFSAEDEVMIDSDFPLFVNHRLEHQQYVSRMAGFVAAYSQEKPDLIDQMLHFLANWWLRHTCESDTKYGRWIRAQGVKRSLAPGDA
jgi:hemerythrin